VSLHPFLLHALDIIVQFGKAPELVPKRLEAIKHRPERTNDADEILHSQENRLLVIRFLRDVTADQARTVWRSGFENNCKPPCYLDPQESEPTMLLSAKPRLWTSEYAPQYSPVKTSPSP
jgi:hypothetical protein